MNDKSQSMLPWLLVLATVGFGIYAVGIGAPYYADDFQFVYEEPQSKFVHYFFHENPTNPLYRPLQASYLALVQTAFGLNTAPIQLLQILLHVLLAALIFRAMTRLGFSVAQARVASLWMVVSQSNVHAVISNDTLSQITGTLFGCLSIWWLYRYCFEGRDGEPMGRYYALALLALALSLWSKESSVSYVAVLAGVVVLERLTADGLFTLPARTLLRLVPIGAVAAAYLFGRSLVVSAAPHFGPGDYSFRIGSNVLANLGLFALGAWVPGSSVSLAVAAKNADYLRLGLAAAAALALVGLVVYGWWRSSRRQQSRLPILIGCAVITLFPMALMNHVSELYVYNSMPFFVMLGGAGLGRLFTLWKADRGRLAALATICLLMALTHGVSVVQKAGMMKRQGHRASFLLERVTPYAQRLPPGGRLVLLNPPETEPGYSSFKQSGFRVLRRGTHRINVLAGRDDISIKIVDSLTTARTRMPCLVLTLFGDHVSVENSAEVCPSASGAGRDGPKRSAVRTRPFVDQPLERPVQLPVDPSSEAVDSPDRDTP